jgi:hypothetical protein
LGTFLEVEKAGWYKQVSSFPAKNRVFESYVQKLDDRTGGFLIGDDEKSRKKWRNARIALEKYTFIRHFKGFSHVIFIIIHVFFRLSSARAAKRPGSTFSGKKMSAPLIFPASRVC